MVRVWSHSFSISSLFSSPWSHQKVKPPLIKSAGTKDRREKYYDMQSSSLSAHRKGRTGFLFPVFSCRGPSRVVSVNIQGGWGWNENLKGCFLNLVIWPLWDLLKRNFLSLISKGTSYLIRFKNHICSNRIILQVRLIFGYWQLKMLISSN